MREIDRPEYGEDQNTAQDLAAGRQEPVAKPDLIWPFGTAVLIGGASVVFCHSIIQDYRRDLEDAGIRPETDIIATLTEPLVTVLVLIPSFVLVVYALIQLMGIQAELILTRTDDSRLRNAATIIFEKIAATSGRQHVKFANDKRRLDQERLPEEPYARLRQQTDRLLHRPIDFGVGALTMLGLLGTIIGLSLALRDIGIVLQPDSESAARQDVLNQLGLAFVTTIVGVAGSLTLSLIQVFIEMCKDRIDALIMR